jgi:transcriptional repressor NrdR
MRCPYCKKMENHVVDSRLAGSGEMIRRRRECEACGARFTTYEKVEIIIPMVLKKDGRREEYQRGKVMAGLRKAFEKRPFGPETLESIADEIEHRISETNRREIDSSKIGEEIMTSLQKVDEVAYVRFASVYRQFKDLGEFMNELKDMLDEKERSRRDHRLKQKKSEARGGRR